MRALFVIHTPKDPLTAVYGFYSELAAYLRNSGHEATILTPQDLPRMARWHARWQPLWYPFAVFLWLLRRSRSYDVAVFHSYAGWVVNVLRACGIHERLRVITAFHGLEPLDFEYVSAQARIIGVPLTLRYRVVHGWLLPRLIAMSCRRSDYVTCCIRQEVEFLERHAWAEPARIVTLGRGVSEEYFRKRPFSSSLRRLLFVGQWIERKGVRYLVEAFHLLASECPDLELWCAGTLVDEAVVRQSFSSAVQPRVKVLTRIPREEMAHVYLAADGFILPTLSEAFGRVVVEAMAAGLPVVTTSTGIATELLKDGVNGLIVPMRDPHAIAEAIRRLAADAALRQSLGTCARATAGQFRSDRVYGDVTTLLLRAAGLEVPVSAATSTENGPEAPSSAPEALRSKGLAS